MIKPIVAILLDEDTSTGGRFYQTNKGYFRAIEKAGGIAIGLPYSHDSIEYAINNCQALLSTGARIRFDDEWYIASEISDSPVSERLEIEKELIARFLAANRPFLGICNGMQVLSALSGAKLSSKIANHTDGSIRHDSADTRHKVVVVKDTKLHKLLGVEEIITNSHHSEGVIEVSDTLLISARSLDGVIEAVERSDKDFAIGVQWHPEIIWPTPTNTEDKAIGEASRALFDGFVSAAKNIQLKS